MSFDPIRRGVCIRAMIFGAMLMAVAACAAAQVEAPKGIRIHPASPELAAKVEKVLKEAFSRDGLGFSSADLVGDVVTCGPILWNRLAGDPAIKSPEKGQTIFVITVAGQ